MGNTKHGIYTWIKHGQLPSIRGKRKIQKVLEELEEGLIADYGGPERAYPLHRRSSSGQQSRPWGYPF